MLLTIRPSCVTIYAVVFAPDGKTLATMGNQRLGPHYARDANLKDMTDQVVRLWDVSSGKEVAVGAEVHRTAHTVVFHPSAKTLAALHLPALAKLPLRGFDDGGRSRTPIEDRLETVHFWDRGFLREKRRFVDPLQRELAEQINISTAWIVGRSSAVPAAFSPDGRVFATLGADEIVLYETASGQPHLRLTGHLQEVTALAFTSDGKKLVSASRDCSVLIWDATGLLPAGPMTASAEDLWGMLADRNSERAGQALWSLVATPAQTLPLLRQHLRPVPAGQDRVSKLVADLDNPKFSVRDRAMQELTRLGEAAEDALTAKLRGGASLETAKRIEHLLERMKTAPTPEQLQIMRGVEILERIGTPEACRQLRELAGGAAGAWLTRQAAESLRRMRRQ